MKDKNPAAVEVDKKTIDDLLARIEARKLEDKDYELIVDLISTVINVNAELEKKNMTISRLRKVFHIKTEKSASLIPAAKQNDDKTKQTVNKSTNEKKKKGHGRIKANDYKYANRKSVHHTVLEPGCICPDCKEGKLYPYKRPGIFVKIKAAPIFQADVYERDNLRCNLCGKLFPAPLPEGVSDQKYDESVSSMIALLKYGSGAFIEYACCRKSAKHLSLNRHSGN